MYKQTIIIIEYKIYILFFLYKYYIVYHFYSVFKIYLNTDISDKKTLLNVQECCVNIIIEKYLTVVSTVAVIRKLISIMPNYYFYRISLEI